MNGNITSENFLRIRSFEPSELGAILELTDAIKHQELDLCENHTLILLFEKPSTRTRVSFSRGFQELGGRIIFLGHEQVQLSRGETVADTARTLSRYVDLIACRTFQQDRIKELGDHFEGPVINALTDRYHPCQALSDIYTILENSSHKDPTIAYVGDGNNVCHSLMEACAAFELKLRIANPPGHQPDPEITEKLNEDDAEIVLYEDPKQAVNEADFVYTDVWVSMGDDDAEERKKTFQPYQVNTELLSHAAKEVKVMHCLPAHRGEEITDDVMDGPRSIVFDQAENRLHVQKALMAHLMADPSELKRLNGS